VTTSAAIAATWIRTTMTMPPSLLLVDVWAVS